MDKDTLLAGINLARERLLATLETIEKNAPHERGVLGWRPAPGRAHIAWQAMHCAVTHDRYLDTIFKYRPSPKPELLERFAYGTVPSDEDVPSLHEIRFTLSEYFEDLRKFVLALDDEGLERTITMRNGKLLTVGQVLLMLGWHEAHHQGQIHLTWNQYKQAHGIVHS